MKKILYLLMSVTLIFGVSCEGEEGPEGPAGPAGPQGAQGPQGLPGADGADGSGQIYEFGNFAFTAEEDFTFGFGFADNNIEVGESDIVLVYKLRFVAEGDSPEEDILYWEPLPQSYLIEEGTLQFNFVHSNVDMVLYLDADFDLTTLDPESLSGFAFRIVIIPGELMNGGRSLAPVDYNNYEEVIKYFNLDDKNVREININ